jgi:hypothetical protein
VKLNNLVHLELRAVKHLRVFLSVLCIISDPLSVQLAPATSRNKAVKGVKSGKVRVHAVRACKAISP